MDRQGKCTGSEKTVAKLQSLAEPDNLQTQHHNHKAKSSKVTKLCNFSFRLRKCAYYRYLLAYPQGTNYNASDEKN